MFERTTEIPIPTGPRRGVRTYPFEDLAVGESVFLPNRPTTASVGQSLKQARVRTGYRFTTHKENGGLRVWRIS